ncbi:UNVERIFIED_CONTAM: hypothetical protein HDU68_004551 [Siphonaria sp. JEL0065]|nr:hypothetical protein HDU68_004551 [Siphonaria sp. JEL0065]
MVDAEETPEELQAQIRALERKLEQKRLQDRLADLRAQLAADENKAKEPLPRPEKHAREPLPQQQQTQGQGQGQLSAADLGLDKKRKLQTHLTVSKKPKWEDEPVSRSTEDIPYIERLKQHQLDCGGLDDVIRTSNFRDRAVILATSKPVSSKPRYSDAQDPSVECYSGIRLKNRKVENSAFMQLLQSRLYIPLTSLTPSLTDADLQGDWVTVAVVIHKSETRTSSNMKPFVILRLGDLKSSTVINAFLFGRVFEKYGGVGGIGIGEVVGVLNPKILPMTEKSSLMGIDIDDPGKLLHLGTSLDSARCKFVSKGNNPKECTTIIDGRKGRHCSYHMEILFKKRKHARAEFSGGSGTTQIGSPTKPKKEYAQNESGSSYLLTDGFQVSTSLDVRPNLLVPTDGGVKGVLPLTKEQLSIPINGENTELFLIALSLEITTENRRSKEAELADVSKVFNKDALQRLGFDPTTGKDVIIAHSGGISSGSNSVNASPAKKAALDERKIKACMAKGIELPKEVFGGMDEFEIDLE